MSDSLAERAIVQFGEAEGAQIIQLASALVAAPAPPPPEASKGRRRPIVVPVARSDAEKAGGAEIVRRTIAAVAPPDDPALPAKAADVIAALKAIGPIIDSLARELEKQPNPRRRASLPG